MEINKTQTDPSPAQDVAEHPKKDDDDDSQQDPDQPKKAGTKQKRENLDEIVTVKRDDAEDVKPQEQFANGGHDEVDECKHKGFSFQRAWCCLRIRRTS